MQLSTEGEVSFTPGETYELVTPYGNEAAAQILFDALQAAKSAKQKPENVSFEVQANADQGSCDTMNL